MKGAKQFLKVLVVTVTLVIGMLYLFQERLIFHSTALPNDYVYNFGTTHKELFLKAKDGSVLNGLHFKQPNPQGVIIYNHGNAGALDAWGLWAQELSNRFGYDVVIWDYRGYGKSTGRRRSKVMLDDGLLFYNYSKQLFSEDEIIVFGRSLGGFFATYIARNARPAKLILESTPTSLLQIAKNEYPFLPSKYLLKFRFQNDENITKIEVPTYILHGTEDQLVPFDHGKQLFERSAAAKKIFYPIKGGEHNNLDHDFEETYFQALNDIL
ncbi:MAG: alpha/beta hydrolase [Pricia sp.]|nr:alpha/beta hydrolase [Pricia sp.]